MLEYALFGEGEPVRAAAPVLGALPLPQGVRAYVGALLSLQGEPAICMLPAVVTIR